MTKVINAITWKEYKALYFEMMNKYAVPNYHEATAEVVAEWTRNDGHDIDAFGEMLNTRVYNGKRDEFIAIMNEAAARIIEK